MYNIFYNECDIDKSQYIIAHYLVESDKNLEDASIQIAIGQSVGNPNVRSIWETDQLFIDHCCKIIWNRFLKQKTGIIQIAFPLSNINWKEDGVSQLLCFLMGGHLDINSITICQLIQLDFQMD